MARTSRQKRSPPNREGLLPVVGFLVVVAVLVGCAGATKRESVTDYVIDDPLLAELFLAAAQQWTDAGVVSAATITINTNPRGRKVLWSSLEDIAKNCGVPELELGEGQFISGCVSRQGGKDQPLWITRIAPAEEISASPELRKRVTANIMHEQMHALLPTHWHLPPGQTGVMSREGGEDITPDDLAFIAQYTEVV